MPGPIEEEVDALTDPDWNGQPTTAEDPSHLKCNCNNGPKIVQNFTETHKKEYIRAHTI